MMLRKALIAAGLRRSRSAFVERSTSGDGSYRVAGYRGARAMIIILRFWRILDPISEGCKEVLHLSLPKDVMVVEPGQNRNGDNDTGPLHRLTQGRVLAQRQVRANLIVIAK